ncbi:MAG: leucine--tRNA ligase [Caldilineaceae bacterium SB0666_bin_21]|nr:leucine--tRNA ligase [Caldilineaceae bacterium SB0666_bin_21]
MSTEIPRYNPAAIEAKWQQEWERLGLYRTVEDPDRPKWYALTMLPYPSGDLHVGHWYAMTPSDTAARYRRMQGANVFFPIGFDAFGLPAENAAIEHGIHPRIWTYDNIDNMRRQLRQMGAMWAWDREAITCEPGYYKWSQWFFLRLLEADLAYREKAPVDWCPRCNTTLAREQVWGEDKHCERCDTPVIQKELEQWKFRITNFADELLSDLETIEWPDPVKIMQTNWIGRSTGAQVAFHTEGGKPIEVFTTRPDTLWGATFMVLAPEHPLVAEITTEDRRATVEAYVERSSRLNEAVRTDIGREKTGEFTGGYAVNPVNGARIPIWIADYVMLGYGTGAIMAVPGHDERDFAFAEQFGLDIVRVISGPDGATGPLTEAWSSKEEGAMMNSDDFDGTPVAEAAGEVIAWLEETGKGRAQVNYRLHDWLISRQRMWGTPIPIVYCQDCGTVPVPYAQLPVCLPEETEFQPSGENALLHTPAFLNTECPKCGNAAQRETDTMDTFMCSSWYQYAYVAPYWGDGKPLTSDARPWSREAGNYWLPVDQYTGGIEHATMHLLYTRFFTKALRDLGVVDFDEPMDRLFNQGMILGADSEKMSKSRGNVVDPDDVVQRYGADTVRGYLMFIGPWDQGGPWDPQRIEGVRRFLNRIWTVVTEPAETSTQDASAARQLEQKLHATIAKVTSDLDHFRFNTAISALMELNNQMMKARTTAVAGTSLWTQAVESMCLMMAPFFPHIAEELWHLAGHEDSVHLQNWPVHDEELARANEITIVVQVNGKVRATVEVEQGMAPEGLEALALEQPNVQPYLDGRELRRAIVVPDKLVNLVV